MESDDEGNLPCILIFDSLPRRRVQNYVDDISLVRQYLTMEWISKAYPKIYVSTNNISFHTEQPYAMGQSICSFGGFPTPT
jgi:hypothetical protein